LKIPADLRSPVPTVDIVIQINNGILLIKRKNPPLGWALPGGFVDYGESLEHAACREAKEETGLDILLLRQFHTYSDPARDTRQHTITTVYVAEAKGPVTAGDDAEDAGVFQPQNLPEPIVFDHRDIIHDFFTGRY
jgi:ADP-ribose pyrophosphatase YjhB (NUDIX family)